MDTGASERGRSAVLAPITGCAVTDRKHTSTDGRTDGRKLRAAGVETRLSSDRPAGRRSLQRIYCSALSCDIRYDGVRVLSWKSAGGSGVLAAVVGWSVSNVLRFVVRLCRVPMIYDAQTIVSVAPGLHEMSLKKLIVSVNVSR